MSYERIVTSSSAAQYCADCSAKPITMLPAWTPAPQSATNDKIFAGRIRPGGVAGVGRNAPSRSRFCKRVPGCERITEPRP